MSQANAHNDGFRIENLVPGWQRLLLGAAGLFCIVTPVWEFSPALLHISPLTLFFAAIIAGAWSVGIPLLYGAIAGDALVWNFQRGELHLDRSSPLRQRTDIIRRTDISHTEIRTIPSDDGPDTYSVVLYTNSGRRIETAKYSSVAKAEEMRDGILRRLDIGRPH